jgi:ribosomal protein S6
MIADTEIESKIEQLKSEIAKAGGSVQSATRLGRISFARPLDKKDAGIYIQVVFMMDAAKINSVHERFRHKEEIMRLQIVSVDTSPDKTAPSTRKEKTK